jgi:hypothetical protein
MPRLRDVSGQASVEFVALLPVVVLAAAALWQAVVAGQAIWGSAGAARAAARAQAIGGDAEASARAALPASLRRGLSVAARPGGVRVEVPIPLVLGGDRLATVTARASLPSQR